MWILAKTLAVLTQTPRYFPDFEWSKKSLIYNVFRLYESIFGRKFGIRHEATTECEITDGKQIVRHYFFTLEARLVDFECRLRKLFKLVPIRVFVPTLATEGFKFPLSPYLFAIAFDVETSNTVASGNQSFSHTATGSNLYMALFTNDVNANTTANISATYAGTSLTQTGTQDSSTGDAETQFFLIAPTSGANTVTTTRTTNSLNIFTMVQTYSGCKQSGQPDSTNSGSNATTTTATLSTTVVATNCWLAGTVRNGNGIAYSGGTGTVRSSGSSNDTSGDSNGTVGTGSQSITFTTASNQTHSWVVQSFAPTPAVVGARLPYLSLLGVGQ